MAIIEGQHRTDSTIINGANSLKRADAVKMAWKRYVLLLGAGVILLFLWWQFYLKDQTVQKRWVLESGTEQSFVAADGKNAIDAIGFCNDEAVKSVFDAYEECYISGIARLVDDQGNVIWQKELKEQVIPTLSLQSTLELEEPIQLQNGTEYHVELLQVSGEPFDNITWSLYGGEAGWLVFYLVLSGSVIVLLTLAYWYCSGFLRLRFGLCWTGGLLAIAMVSMLVMVPPCVPDEELHFGSAYAISNSWMELIPGCADQSNEVPSGVLRMKGFDDEVYLRQFWTDWGYGNQTVNGANGYQLEGMMPHYSYAVSAVGITLCRLLHAPYQMYIIAARLMNVLLYAIVTLLAMKAFPPLKRSVIAVSLLPSCLWMMNSCSYDVWNLSFCILFVCLCASLASQEKVALRELFFALLVFVAFAPIKFIYVNFVFMLLFVKPQNIIAKHKKALAAGAGLLVLLCAAVVLEARGQEVLAFLGRGGFDLRAGIGMDTTYSLAWVIRHPVTTALVYIKSAYSYGGDLVIKLFMGDQFMEGIPLLLMMGILISFAYVVCGTQGDKVRRSKQSRVIAGFVVLTGVVIVMSSFLFVYSYRPEAGIGVIKGMQGRYFIPYLICIPFLAPRIRKSADSEKRTVMLLYGMSLCSLLTRFSWVISA